MQWGDESEKWAENTYRRAPLEKGRDGLMKNHFAFYFSANRKSTGMD